MEAASREQSEYYDRTGATYDAAHLVRGDGHYVALEYVAGLCIGVRAESLLDVGSGTGRALRFLRSRCPAMTLNGVEPSGALRVQALAQGLEVVDGNGEDLPFEDDSFDVVLATAVMHHVRRPDVLVAEMTRVARKAVMISDANRYGQGGYRSGLAKAVLRISSLWQPYMMAKTKGKGYLWSEGDGVFYSYSVYDSVEQLSDWADRVFIVPTAGRSAGAWAGPLFTSTQGLLVGVKEPCFAGWACEDPT